MPIKKGEGLYSTDPEFKKRWDDNSGQWADKEKAREAGRKGAAVSNARRAAKKQLKEMLSNPDGFREEAMEAILEEHPDAMDQLARAIFNDALEGDKAARELAAKMFGIEAPKKTEIKVEQEMTAEEAEAILRAAMEK